MTDEASKVSYDELIKDRDNKGLAELLKSKESTFDQSRLTAVMRQIAQEPSLTRGKEMASHFAGQLYGEYEKYIEFKRRLSNGETLNYNVFNAGKWVSREVTSPDQLTPELFAHRFAYGTIETRLRANELSSSEIAKIREIAGVSQALTGSQKIAVDRLADIPRLNGFSKNEFRTGVVYSVTEKYPDDNSNELFRTNAQEGVYGDRRPIIRKTVFVGDPSLPNSLIRYYEDGLDGRNGYQQASISVGPVDSAIDTIASFIRHIESN